MTSSKKDVPFYVDEEAHVFTGPDAVERLATRSASIDSEHGVVAVERARWDEAQRYERSSWLERGRRLWDDRNRAHQCRFAGYNSLRGRRFRRVIELGCGPFTNLRYILESIEAGQVELLDPLAADYQNHAFCRYSGGRLGGLLRVIGPSAWPAVRKPLRYAAEVINSYRVGGWSGRPVEVHAAGIEDFRPKGTYDLVVMINVLEHCRDARTVFEIIANMLEPGGLFVYADKVFDATRLAERSGQFFDAGHPLMVDYRLVEAWLSNSYEVVMRAYYERGGDGPASGDVYFVGRRKVQPVDPVRQQTTSP